MGEFINCRLLKSSISYSVLVIALLATACNPTRRLADDEVFLKKNKVSIEDSSQKTEVSVESLESVIKQRTNRKILFVRFNLGAYNMVDPDKRDTTHVIKEIKHGTRVEKKRRRLAEMVTKGASRGRVERKKQRIEKFEDKDPRTWRDWLSYTVGEPPVILDSTKTEKTAEQMSVYMKKHGYFNNQVSHSTEYNHDSTKACVKYEVVPHAPYRLRSLEYKTTDEGISRRLDFLLSQSLLDTGMVFNIDELDDERERVTKYLNNRGYYSFSKAYINFEVDSTLQSGEVDVDMVIKSLSKESELNPDSLVEVPHQRYFIGDIYLHTTYDSRATTYAPSDTLKYHGLNILYDETLQVKESLLAFLMDVAKGDLYQKSRVETTHRRLNSLGIFRAVNIQFRVMETEGPKVLDCHILMTPGKKQTFAAESTGTHRDGIMGISADLVYRHKNLFKGAENTEAKVNFGLEAQQSITQSEVDEISGEDLTNNLRLNTFEIGPELKMTMHKLLLPIPQSMLSKSTEPTTTIQLGFNYQDRPDYRRILSHMTLKYQFTENRSKGSQFFTDLDLSVIDIDRSPAFDALLEQLDDDFLANSYKNHLIPSVTFSWIWNSQKNQIQRHYHYRRISVGEAGNIWRLLHESPLLNVELNENDGYEAFGIQFAQYWKAEIDQRYYVNFGSDKSVAMRIYGGVGRPQDNLSVLPFDKSFFSGGSNGIRAWQARTLGPGSFRDTTALVTFNNSVKLSSRRILSIVSS
jgi:hypothetical protein